MSLLNLESDGLYPELIVLFKTVAYSKALEKDALVQMCTPKVTVDHERAKARLRGVLNRWTEIGLFEIDAGAVRLNESIQGIKEDSLDKSVALLPGICRKLVMGGARSLPLWGDEQSREGVAVDFIRGATWVLAQNIYDFSSVFTDVESLFNEQSPKNRIMVNDTRWNGLRFWMQYLGFAGGGEGAFELIQQLQFVMFCHQYLLQSQHFLLKTFLKVLLINYPYLISVNTAKKLSPVWIRVNGDHLLKIIYLCHCHLRCVV
ncbi:hypothetical protein FNV82_09425 [Chlorobium phaeovibrioides]|nr:protein DpdG [Chlorobium phaeovibrioides]QEQ57704.1 hypothetical protein FNV82_09425 [Chlorobium phaeovibrioides]